MVFSVCDSVDCEIVFFGDVLNVCVFVFFDVFWMCCVLCFCVKKYF